MTIVNGPRRYGIGGPDSEILAGLAALAAGSGIASGLGTWAATASFGGFLASTAIGAYLFLTLYSLGPALRIMTLIVSVRLFSLMFGISSFLDDALIDAMYPGMKLADAGRWEVDRVALGYVTMSLHLLLPLGLLWVVYAAGGYAMRGLDALGPSADPTGIGMATRVGTSGMARNISRR